MDSRNIAKHMAIERLLSRDEARFFFLSVRQRLSDSRSIRERKKERKH